MNLEQLIFTLGSRINGGREVGVLIGRGRGGNFDKIKGKGLFVNEIRFYH